MANNDDSDIENILNEVRIDESGYSLSGSEWTPSDEDIEERQYKRKKIYNTFRFNRN